MTMNIYYYWQLCSGIITVRFTVDLIIVEYRRQCKGILHNTVNLYHIKEKLVWILHKVKLYIEYDRHKLAKRSLKRLYETYKTMINVKGVASHRLNIL